MSKIISPVLPFPNLCWWAMAAQSSVVILDEAEHFEKMTYRNRYYITGPNGLIQLSIPLLKGREQRNAMRNVMICNKDRWQIQHWRTLVSVYNRAPYFEHYALSLEPMYMQPYERLIDFNKASLYWLKQQLKAGFTEEATTVFVSEYPTANEDVRRNFKPRREKQPMDVHPYYQLFSERNGFLPNLSILDLLFSEGPHSLQWVRSNREMLLSWR